MRFINFFYVLNIETNAFTSYFRYYKKKNKQYVAETISIGLNIIKYSVL
jgi:hypothetical protein